MTFSVYVCRYRVRCCGMYGNVQNSPLCIPQANMSHRRLRNIICGSEERVHVAGACRKANISLLCNYKLLLERVAVLAKLFLLDPL